MPEPWIPRKSHAINEMTNFGNLVHFPIRLGSHDRIVTTLIK